MESPQECANVPQTNDCILTQTVNVSIFGGAVNDLKSEAITGSPLKSLTHRGVGCEGRRNGCNSLQEVTGSEPTSHFL